MKKVLLISHARSGKDTVANMLESMIGLKNTSSSRYALFEVPEIQEELVFNYYGANEPNPDLEAIYFGRKERRAFWYNTISNYNSNDPTRLAREIFRDYDIYNGLRDDNEFRYAKAYQLYDICIWVDASERVPPEDISSMKLNKGMADIILDNNGTELELVTKVKQLSRLLL